MVTVLGTFQDILRTLGAPRKRSFYIIWFCTSLKFYGKAFSASIISHLTWYLEQQQNKPVRSIYFILQTKRKGYCIYCLFVHSPTHVMRINVFNLLVFCFQDVCSSGWHCAKTTPQTMTHFGRLALALKLEDAGADAVWIIHT